MLFLVIVLIGLSLCLISLAIVPWADDLRRMWQAKEEKVIQKEMDNTFYYNRTPRQVVRLYYLLPPILAAIAFIFSRNALFSLVSALIGFSIPTMILKSREKKRRKRFLSQLIDGIMLLSSSLKGGLSLLQALEVLVEEMPAPISQEFGLVVRENKMGVTLDESLRRVKKKMHMNDLDLIINSILVARETGGDLTKIFSRLCTTIRDNQKLQESIKTLTMQGRLQGAIMSFLPFLFVGWVVNFNKHHFDIMFQDETGRILLVVAVVLQIVGMFFIHKFSSIKV